MYLSLRNCRTKYHNVEAKTNETDINYFVLKKTNKQFKFWTETITSEYKYKSCCKYCLEQFAYFDAF